VDSLQVMGRLGDSRKVAISLYYLEMHIHQGTSYVYPNMVFELYMLVSFQAVGNTVRSLVLD
jgi:hypothetical protein